MDEKNTQTLTVTDQKKACITGVGEVNGVTQERITFTLLDNKKITVTGTGLKISGFSKQTTSLFIDGNVSEIRFFGDKSILKRLLK